jgi:hypothetical protein
VDTVLMRLVDISLSLPGILIAVLLSVAWQRGAQQADRMLILKSIFDLGRKVLGSDENVKKYLHSRGIENERLSTVGYGPDRPLNTGATREEKVQNRRVELKLSNE